MFWSFTSLSMLFKSCRDNGRVIMKDSQHNEMPYSHEQDWNLGTCDPKSEALTTWPQLFKTNGVSYCIIKT